MEKKIVLNEEEIPKQWYNILPDLPKEIPPPISPFTGEPVKFEELKQIFPRALIEQEVSKERFIDIPEEVREIYSIWRPTPLIRAERLERALKTPAKIYFKYEGVSPPGSHKPNTAVAQVYYNMKEGIKRLTTETGAGQWGSALSMACKLFELQCTVYMVRTSYYQKPYRKTLMQIWGAEVIPSPSERTESGRRFLQEDPETPGSLGMAISEAVEDAAKHDDTNYSLGSVLNHVLLHQTIIGLEAKKQLEIVEEYPDVVIGCVGGGSNFAGIAYPFYYDRVRRGAEVRLVAVEPSACPTLTKGVYSYDYGDTAGIVPILKMFTLGHDFVPPPIHAGGLRYHGDAPTLSLLVAEGEIEAVAVPQNPTFEAAVMFAQTEGIVVAPETAHAVRVAIDEAIKAKEENEEKVILFNCSGHGYFDLGGYEKYLAGELVDVEYPEEKIKESLKKLPKVKI
ncbi:MAG: TrpB-like pyridoxal phosphate-dependent enzyme [Archaeoglobi archaeon]|nr:TrpB-like pyridoxal phosphate-dependent enzyme [Candidatus Mnemosynella sp.]